MKTTKQMLLALALLATSLTTYAQVGINTENPDASAALDIESSTLGLLPPRMTTAERNAINSGAPAEGLTIYNETTKCLEFFNGTVWVNQCTGVESNPSLNLSDIQYQGISVINSQGIGYNGEAVPATSTITVDLQNTSAVSQDYTLIATDPTTGLEYSASGTIAASTTIDDLVLNNNEPTIAADTFGIITMTLNGSDNPLTLEPRIDILSIPADDTMVVDVSVSADYDNDPMTANTSMDWMDRNLGARQAATASNDVLSYGNLYQWGRPSDDHELIVTNGDDPDESVAFNTSTTPTLAVASMPLNSDFITALSTPFDWTDSPDDSLWDFGGTNNPCPSGYRVPTITELEAMVAALGITDGATAASSTLAVPSPGRRFRDDGTIISENQIGNYWSISPAGIRISSHRFLSGSVGRFNRARANGLSVRCIKD